MNTTKKVMAILLVLVMVAALSVSAFAAGTGTIKVDNVQKGETYKVYKLLDYTSSGDNYSYFLSADDYAAKGEALKGVGFEFDKSADGTRYNVNNTKTLSEATLIANLKAAEENGDLDDLLVVTKTAESDKEEILSSSLEYGYYFITTTTGSLVTLSTYNDEALVVDKHEPSNVVKTVNKTSTFVGDTLTFSVTVEAKKGATVTLTDTLSTGLTLNGTAPTVNVGSGYDVTSWVTTPSASSYEIEFDQVDADTTFVVTYTATVNSDALNDDNNPVTNTATISWGHQTDTYSTSTPLYGFEIQKENESKEALAGVKFTLKNGDKYYDGESVWTSTKTELETDKDGKISVQGIAAGTYVLTETETLDGYNLLKEDVIITVADDGTVTVSNDKEVAVAEDGVVTVVNTSGSILPSTGSIGTTIFYILGSILVIGAGVVLVSKRRMTE